MGPHLESPLKEWGLWTLHQRRGLSAWALTGTFITHSCAVLGPTDCGKPISLQEVSPEATPYPDPTLSFTS